MFYTQTDGPPWPLIVYKIYYYYYYYLYRTSSGAAYTVIHYAAPNFTYVGSIFPSILNTHVFCSNMSVDGSSTRNRQRATNRRVTESVEARQHRLSRERELAGGSV